MTLFRISAGFRTKITLIMLVILSSFLTIGISQEKISSKLNGWDFRSFPSPPNFFPESKDQGILLISLLDGTLMALDAFSGAILWTVNEKRTFLYRECISFGCYFYPSTSNELYFLINGVAHLVNSNTFGWLTLKKLLNIVDSHVDVVTLGVNILSGKLHFFTSSQTCFKNSSDPLSQENLDNLIIIKRTKKIVQIFDIDSQTEILKLSTISHDASLYSTDDSPTLIPPFKGLDYDLDNSVLYYHVLDSKLPQANCWSASLSSPISKIWYLPKTSKHFSLIPINLLDIMTIKSKKISKSFRFKLKRFSDKLYYRECQDNLIRITFKNYAFLQNIRNDPKNFNCPIKPVVSIFEKLNESYLLRKFYRIRDRISVPSDEYDPFTVSPIFRHSSNKAVGADYTKVLVDSKIVSIQPPPWFYKRFFVEFSSTLLCVGVVFFIVYLFIHHYHRKCYPTVDNPAFITPPLKTKISKNGIANKFFQDPYESDSSEVSECKLLTPTIHSRYASEFQHIQDIGVGGYGVVYKARNYMDQCVYAVKRITVSDCVAARERTIREVHALAQLSHSGIIRFYAAWFEQAASRDMAKLSKSLAEKVGKENKEHHYHQSILTKSNTTESDDTDIVFDYDSKNPRPTKPLWNDVTTIKESVSAKKLTTSDGSDDSEDSNTFVVTCHGKHGCQHLNSVYLYIQMELCHKETLRSFLIKKPARHMPTMISIFEQILGAVRYFHSQKLMHRDLKPSNIFFSFDGSVKIGDFGLVTRFNLDQSKDLSLVSDGSDDDAYNIDTVTKLVGTELYMAPELLEKRPYDFKVDIYSLGLVFFEILVPFYSLYERAFVMARAKELAFPSDCKNLSEDSVTFIKLMMSCDPSCRPSISELMGMELTQRILSVSESIEFSKQRMVEILSEISKIHIYSDCSV